MRTLLLILLMDVAGFASPIIAAVALILLVGN